MTKPGRWGVERGVNHFLLCHVQNNGELVEPHQQEPFVTKHRTLFQPTLLHLG